MMQYQVALLRGGRKNVPSSARVLLKQSTIPLYLRSRRPCLIISSWFWIRSLTRSIGAAAVFETAAETPPIKKSIIKFYKHHQLDNQTAPANTLEQLQRSPRAPHRARTILMIVALAAIIEK